MRSASEPKRGELGLPNRPSSCSGDLMQYEGDLVSMSGLLCQGVQCVCVAQVEQVACRAVSSCVLVDVVAELRLTCGHVRFVRVVVGAPKAVAEGASAAAGGQEGCPGVKNGVSDRCSALLGGLGLSHASSVMET